MTRIGVRAVFAIAAVVSLPSMSSAQISHWA